MFKKMVIGVAVLSALGLSGCSMLRSDLKKTGEMAGAGVVQSFALPGEPSYQGDRYAFYQNKDTAPSNQVYYFAYDSSQMTAKDQSFLQQQANYLVSHPDARVRLEGNTDSRGSREYNVALGWRRDQSVAHLLQQYGVRHGQINMVSFGKEHPAVAEDNQRAWSLNRRVNMVYTRH